MEVQPIDEIQQNVVPIQPVSAPVRRVSVPAQPSPVHQVDVSQIINDKYRELSIELNRKFINLEATIRDANTLVQTQNGELNEIVTNLTVLRQSVEKQTKLQRQLNKNDKQMREEPQNFPPFTEVLPIEEGEDLAETMRNSFPYMSVIDPEDIANNESLRDTFLRVLLAPPNGDYTRQPIWYYQRLRAYLTEALTDVYTKLVFCCVQEFNPIVVRRIDGGSSNPLGNSKKTIQHFWETYRDCISELYNELPVFARCYAYLDEINIFGVSTDVHIYPHYTINNDPDLAYNMVFTEYPYQCLRYDEFVFQSQLNEFLLSLEQLMIVSNQAYESVYKYTNDLALDSIFVSQEQFEFDDVHAYPFALITYNFNNAEYEFDGERHINLIIPEPVMADTPAEDFQWILLRIYAALEDLDEDYELIDYDEKIQAIGKLYEWIFDHPIEDALYFYRLNGRRLYPPTFDNIQLGERNYKRRVERLERQTQTENERNRQERERRENEIERANREREEESKRVMDLARETYDSYMQRLQREREERTQLKTAKRLARDQAAANEREKQRAIYDAQRAARKEARERRMQEKRERIGQEARRQHQLKKKKNENRGILAGFGKMLGLGGAQQETGTESFVRREMDRASSTWDEADMTLNSTDNVDYYIPRQVRRNPVGEQNVQTGFKVSKIYDPIPQRKVKVPVRKMREIKERKFLFGENTRQEEYIEMEDRLEDYELNVTNSMIKLNRTTCSDKISEFREFMNVESEDELSENVIECYEKLESPVKNIRIRSEKLESISDAIGSDIGNKNIPDPKSVPNLATVDGLQHQLKMLFDYYKLTMNSILNMLFFTTSKPLYEEQRGRVFNQYVCDLIYTLDRYSCLRRLISRNPTAVDINSIFGEAVADAIEYAWSLKYPEDEDDQEAIDDDDAREELLYRYASVSLV